MPDFEVLFYALGSLFFFDRYLNFGQRKDFFLTLIFLALTFLTKINYLFVAAIVVIMLFLDTACERSGWEDSGSLQSYPSPRLPGITHTRPGLPKALMITLQA